MSYLSSYLPPGDGLLPRWLLLVSTIALGNSIQAYTTLHYTQRLYSGPSPTTPSTSTTAPSTSPATPLQARTFGTWTFLQSLVRLYGAYHISDPLMYELVLWTYGIAFAHFVSEWLVFRTARWGVPLAFPVAISTGSLVWMVAQWGWYVR
ncbi:ergosterol 28 [Cryomyces antarcticus]